MLADGIPDLEQKQAWSALLKTAHSVRLSAPWVGIIISGNGLMGKDSEATAPVLPAEADSEPQVSAGPRGPRCAVALGL